MNEIYLTHRKARTPDEHIANLRAERAIATDLETIRKIDWAIRLMNDIKAVQ